MGPIYYYSTKTKTIEVINTTSRDEFWKNIKVIQNNHLNSKNIERCVISFTLDGIYKGIVSFLNKDPKTLSDEHRVFFVT